MTKHSLIIALVLLLTACAANRDYVVGYDYSYQGNFKKYKTYAFMKHAADPLTAQNAPKIEEEIKFRMKLLGYEYSDNKPDLFIIFKIFEDNFKFKGYSQPELKNWIATEDTTSLNYSPVRYELNNGTLLILMNDRKRRTTAWQGYASGIRSETQAISQRVLKSSIISIFDQYEIFANSAIQKKEVDD
ncbi:MAG: DUF4136 domain-containing protein [Microscillaceae bacterium]|jgi:hypothetical protein|nr:DUF4136 domain-containing protein [Microscillaceae bacterium]